jgi:hypothetical protein
MQYVCTPKLSNRLRRTEQVCSVRQGSTVLNDREHQGHPARRPPPHHHHHDHTSTCNTWDERAMAGLLSHHKKCNAKPQECAGRRRVKNLLGYWAAVQLPSVTLQMKRGEWVISVYATPNRDSILIAIAASFAMHHARNRCETRLVASQHRRPESDRPTSTEQSRATLNDVKKAGAKVWVLQHRSCDDEVKRTYLRDLCHQSHRCRPTSVRLRSDVDDKTTTPDDGCRASTNTASADERHQSMHRHVMLPASSLPLLHWPDCLT